MDLLFDQSKNPRSFEVSFHPRELSLPIVDGLAWNGLRVSAPMPCARDRIVWRHTSVQSTILVPNRWISHRVNGVNGELICNR
jgi:hypothetical protein